MEPIITNINEITLKYEPRACNLMSTKLSSTEDTFKLLMAFYDSDTISIMEEFIVIYLNNSNSVIGVYKGFKGGITSTHVDARIIMNIANSNSVIGVYKGFKGGITSTHVDARIIMNIALKSLSTGIILSHNHPSGNLSASQADIACTKEIKKCCSFHGIKLLDHVIVVPGGKYYSLAEEGLLT